MRELRRERQRKEREEADGHRDKREHDERNVYRTHVRKVVR